MRRPRFTKRISKIMSLDEFFYYAENFPIKTENTNDFKNGGRILINNEIRYYLRSMDIFFTKSEIESMYQKGDDYQRSLLLGYVER